MLIASVGLACSDDDDAPPPYTPASTPLPTAIQPTATIDPELRLAICIHSTGSAGFPADELLENAEASLDVVEREHDAYFTAIQESQGKDPDDLPTFVPMDITSDCPQEITEPETREDLLSGSAGEDIVVDDEDVQVEVDFEQHLSVVLEDSERLVPLDHARQPYQRKCVEGKGCSEISTAMFITPAVASDPERLGVVIASGFGWTIPEGP